MKTKQTIFIVALIIICNYFAYYFGSQMPDYYSSSDDLQMVIPGIMFILISIAFDSWAITYFGVELYEYLGK